MAKDINKWASPGYLKNIGIWSRLRDCFDGEDAIKQKGEAYLPRLKGQSNEDYNNYLRRALFFPITGKTAMSMVGMATVKPPKVAYPSLMEPYFIDTEQDYQWTEFYTSLFTEVVLQGRYGALIDAPADGSPLPDIVPYIAENIMRWVTDKNGQAVDIILREYREVPTDAEFETDIMIVYRRCWLSEGVYYTQELDEDLKAMDKPPVAPTFMGSTIDFIPFVCFGASGCHWSVDKQPMADICSINLSHYLTSADLEWGRHIVGLPTPVVTGVDSGTVLHIGGTAAWILPTPEAKAMYLEFQGQGLGSLEKAMTDKISLMSTMSARLVDSSTRGSEAAETVRLRYMNESASLMHTIVSIEAGCNLLYNMLAKLIKADGVVKIEFPKDILGTSLTFADLQVLFTAYLNGSVSKETLVYNLSRLEALDPDRTLQQELDAIKDPPPKPQPAGNNPPGNKQPATT